MYQQYWQKQQIFDPTDSTVEDLGDRRGDRINNFKHLHTSSWHHENFCRLWQTTFKMLIQCTDTVLSCCSCCTLYKVCTTRYMLYMICVHDNVMNNYTVHVTLVMYNIHNMYNIILLYMTSVHNIIMHTTCHVNVCTTVHTVQYNILS